jgi:hypothetical protein
MFNALDGSDAEAIGVASSLAMRPKRSGINMIRLQHCKIKMANGAMDRITMPSALLSCLLLIPLRGQESCQKQVVIRHRGRSIKNMRAFLVALSVILLTATAGRADSPLEPPARYSKKSPTGSITVTSDPRRGTTARDNTNKKILWSLPDWYRSLFPSDDGSHLVTEYDGLNLVPDYDGAIALFTFWKNGRKIRDVTLKEFIPSKRILQQTTSHYYWGKVKGINDSNQLSVSRADGKEFVYDLDSGMQKK